MSTGTGDGPSRRSADDAFDILATHRLRLRVPHGREHRSCGPVLQAGAPEKSKYRENQGMLRVLSIAVALVVAAACAHRRLADTSDPFDYIPARWVDLPEAPFVARMRGNKALLVARSKERFRGVGIGCVRTKGGRTHVIADLVELTVTDGFFGPGWPVETPFNDLNNPQIFAELNRKSRCPADSYWAITRAGGIGPVWNAGGTKWPVKK